MISYNEINTLNILNHDNYAHVQKEGRVFVFVGVAEFEFVFVVSQRDGLTLMGQ